MMNIFTFSKPSALVLIYGLYSVLCHSVFVLFGALSSGASSSQALAIKYAPMLEHSVMSLVLVIGGALLIEITITKDMR